MELPPHGARAVFRIRAARRFVSFLFCFYLQ
jgi:hypothetical protein